MTNILTGLNFQKNCFYYRYTSIVLLPTLLNSQKVWYSHCTYVNTEGAQDLFMEEEFGARIQRRAISNGYHHMAPKVLLEGVNAF
jgi:hypothetical protein